MSMIYIIIGILVLFLILGLAIATYSGAQLEDTFNAYDKVRANKNITGGEFALFISNKLLNGKIKVVRTDGYLTDGYISKSKTVVLSESTCNVASVAALTVVSHEFGHALQDLNNSKRFNLGKKLGKTVRILGFFMFPLIILGIFLFFIIPQNIEIGISLMGIGGGIFLLALLFKLITIPIERDASKRGIELLKKTGILDSEELLMAKDLLKTALLTYVGDFLRVVLWWTFLSRKAKLF